MGRPSSKPPRPPPQHPFSGSPTRAQQRAQLWADSVCFSLPVQQAWVSSSPVAAHSSSSGERGVVVAFLEPEVFPEGPGGGPGHGDHMPPGCVCLCCSSRALALSSVPCPQCVNKSGPPSAPQFSQSALWVSRGPQQEAYKAVAPRRGTSGTTSHLALGRGVEQLPPSWSPRQRRVPAKLAAEAWLLRTSLVPHRDG